jgi:hypothetical protein
MKQIYPITQSMPFPGEGIRITQFAQPSPMEKMNLTLEELLALLSDGVMRTEGLIAIFAFLSKQDRLLHVLRQDRLCFYGDLPMINAYTMDDDLGQQFPYMYDIKAYLLQGYDGIQDIQTPTTALFVKETVEDGMVTDLSINGKAVIQMSRAGISTEIKTDDTGYDLLETGEIHEENPTTWIYLTHSKSFVLSV